MTAIRTAVWRATLQPLCRPCCRPQRRPRWSRIVKAVYRYEKTTRSRPGSSPQNASHNLKLAQGSTSRGAYSETAPVCSNRAQGSTSRGAYSETAPVCSNRAQGSTWGWTQSEASPVCGNGPQGTAQGNKSPKAAPARGNYAKIRAWEGQRWGGTGADTLFIKDGPPSTTAGQTESLIQVGRHGHIKAFVI